MKKSMVLLEVIVSILLFSTIAIISSKMMFTLVKENHNDTFLVQNNLTLETTRLFISKNNYFDKYKLNDGKLYYENNLLLKNISKYSVSEQENIKTINICIYDNSICQIWKIKI